jgi:HEAT repeat protein
VNDPDNRVRANAAKALAVFGRPEGRSTLEAMLRDADESMRLSAAWALGQVRLEGARAILEERSRVETIPAVSARIAEALAALAAQPAAGGPA